MVLPVVNPPPSVSVVAAACSAAKTANLSSAKRVSFGTNNAQIVLFSAGEHSNSNAMQCSNKGITQ